MVIIVDRHWRIDAEAKLVLTLAGVANNLKVPLPLWCGIASLVVLMPAAY